MGTCLGYAGSMGVPTAWDDTTLSDAASGSTETTCCRLLHTLNPVSLELSDWLGSMMMSKRVTGLYVFARDDYFSMNIVSFAFCCRKEKDEKGEKKMASHKKLTFLAWTNPIVRSFGRFFIAKWGKKHRNNDEKNRTVFFCVDGASLRRFAMLFPQRGQFLFAVGVYEHRSHALEFHNAVQREFIFILGQYPSIPGDAVVECVDAEVKFGDKPCDDMDPADSH
jgi:hypothetical protein